MEAFQKRVADEKTELDDKTKKLFAFFETSMFEHLPSDERSRLRVQGLLMKAYSEVLGQRIAKFI